MYEKAAEICEEKRMQPKGRGTFELAHFTIISRIPGSQAISINNS